MAIASLAVGLSIIILSAIGIVFIVFFRRTNSINDDDIADLITNLKKLSRSQIADVKKWVAKNADSKSV